MKIDPGQTKVNWPGRVDVSAHDPRSFAAGRLTRLVSRCGRHRDSPQKPPTLPKISAISSGSTSVTTSKLFVAWWITIATWAYGLWRPVLV